MLIIISLIVAGILFFIAGNIADEYMSGDTAVGIGILGFILFGLGIIFGFWAIAANILKEADTASLQQEYAVLTYQLKNLNTIYGNSVTSDKKELFDQIQKWNSMIASYSIGHNNIWTNWFYPIDISNFSIISLGM